MSSWVVEGFDTTFTQPFVVFEKMIMNKFFFKIMKKGTINSSASFTFTLLDGSTTLFTETIGAAQVNKSLLKYDILILNLQMLVLIALHYFNNNPNGKSSKCQLANRFL